MIEGIDYVNVVKAYYSFLIIEFGFEISEEKIRRNAFYDVQYKDETRIISISYENIEDYFLVIIYLLENGKMSDYDDKTKTLHLSKLNVEVLSVVDKNKINLNNQHFANFNPKSKLESRLLKSAKELRLCLHYFNGL